MLHKRKFAQLDWITEEGNAAQTADLKNVNGILHKVEIKISSVSADPTVGVALIDITDTDFVATSTLETFTGLADGTLHRFLRENKEFDGDKDIDGHVFCWNDLRITVTPSADPGGEAQTLAVDVTLYLEE